MKDLIILLLGLIIGFLIWNSRQVARYSGDGSIAVAAPSDAPVSPDVTQVILEAIQKNAGYPLETLYIKSLGDDTYDARFMFFNTEGYFGTQYDVKAHVTPNGSVNIISQSETATTGDAANPAYVPDKYQPYEVIESNLDQQLKDALKANKGTPGGLIGTPRELASGASAPAPAPAPGPSPSYRM
jgi:hypothetical protein